MTAVPLVCNHLTADALRLCHQTGHHRILHLLGGQPCLPQLDVGVGQGGFQRQCVETVYPQLRLEGLEQCGVRRQQVQRQPSWLNGRACRQRGQLRRQQGQRLLDLRRIGD